MQKNHATAVRDTLQESAEERLSVSIYGDCMAPHLTAGQRVSVQALRRFWPGDILVFYSPRQDRLIAHRLIGAFRRDGRWRLLTQADNAQNPDPALEPHQVIGRVVEPRTSPGKRLAAACRFSLSLGRDCAPIEAGDPPHVRCSDTSGTDPLYGRTTVPAE
jgi:hypothetical protein